MDRVSVGAYIRQQKELNPENACRCLFGPVNAVQNKQFIQEQNAAHLKEMKDKYNFDFQKEAPVDGKYKWERVGSNDQENIPEVYAMHQLTKDVFLINATNKKKYEFSSNLDRITPDLTFTNSQGNEATLGVENIPTGSSLSTTSQDFQGKNNKRQTTITEYFPAKKSRSGKVKSTDVCL